MKRVRLKGSYTIEATLLMGIILPFLTAIIYMGFFLHDRGFLQGAALETAACMSLCADEKEFDGAAAAQGLIGGRLLATKGTSAEAVQGKRQVQVAYEGNFCVPALAGPFWGRQGIALSAKVTLNTERPSKRIRQLRAVAKTVNTFRRALE